MKKIMLCMSASLCFALFSNVFAVETSSAMAKDVKVPHYVQDVLNFMQNMQERYKANDKDALKRMQTVTFLKYFLSEMCLYSRGEKVDLIPVMAQMILCCHH